MKKKEIVPRKMYFYNSDKESEEQVPNWDDSVEVRGYYSDLDKLM